MSDTLEKFDEHIVNPKTHDDMLERLRKFRDNLTLPPDHLLHLKKMSLAGVDPGVIYDIGSSLLHWTSVAKVCWPRARIICFDGMRELEFLYKERGQEFYPAILSDTHRDVSWYQSMKWPGGNSYYRESGEVFPKGSELSMWAVPLDSLVKEMGLPYPDMMKLDVQGAEKDVLSGATECLKNCKRLIVEMQRFQYNEGAPLLPETLKFIMDMGFECDAPLFCDNGPDGDFSFVRQ